MLSVCSSSTDVDLTTTSVVRREIFGATATSTAEDAYLSDLIRAGSLWAERYVGYPLTRQIYSETLAAYDTQSLMVSRTPIARVLRVFDATDTGSADQLTSTEYRVENADAGLISRDQGFDWTAQTRWNLGPNMVAGSELRPWLVDYSAGFVGAGGKDSTADGTTSTGRTLPEDIERAVVKWVAREYRRTGSVASKSVGDLSISYRSEDLGGPEALLEAWRRIA